jgi:hypothetical protein
LGELAFCHGHKIVEDLKQKLKKANNVVTEKLSQQNKINKKV